MISMLGTPTPPSPQEARQAAAERAERTVEMPARRQKGRAATARVRKLEAVCHALDAKLASIHDDAPECNELTRLFHEPAIGCSMRKLLWSLHDEPSRVQPV